MKNALKVWFLSLPAVWLTAHAGLPPTSLPSYSRLLRIQLREHFDLPEKLRAQKLKATVGIRVNEAGKIVAEELKKSSGNAQFDQVAMNAVKSTSRLPKPPKSLLGQEILLELGE